MRLLRGRGGWWYVGRAGTALLPGALVSGGRLTPEGVRQVAAAGIDRVPAPEHYSLTVVTSTACNLGCPYCFQNTPDGARRITPAKLDARGVAACVEFTETRMAELGARRLELLLFGGEPLLNPAACVALLHAFGERMPTTASMVSNGVLLTPRRAVELAGAGLRDVQITLDGPRPRHDSVRATRGGRSTFDTILSNVAIAQRDTALRFTMRVNVTPENLPELPELLDQAAAVLDPGRTRLALAPVLDYGRGLAVPGEHAAERAVDAYALAVRLGFRLVRPRDTHCDFCSETAGRLGAVVGPDGTLFSCWDAVGEPDLAVGTLAGGYDPDPGPRWRRCGGPEPSAGAFTDAVDAGVLDLIRATAGREVTSR
ncbi:uncharacterized protein FHX82_005066 [Amycolatopsis bartoniae]|uniref:Radical SAM core domain-containing protein n=1 Tax=Amycolatopsis bartoniae TaxID=941986 RepID=A0A8H9IPI5_9PSEU|nr:radical SAM protein [Amycolatopsis bartoniae]MBB2937990.1 uncharacterized protein [Amycolatopsis bartoniae]TVT07564.1 radical SAM protein [Amycolatopsis bartoniae]GHF42157.1 hypothetical protein GCM10017566_14670 [Amycolatopsis bartoniae]